MVRDIRQENSQIVLRAISEDQFLKQIIDLAHVYGWKACHTRAARTSKGWRTPVQGDGAGFPDLILVREIVIFAELKNEKGKISDAQEDWITTLNIATQTSKNPGNAYIWRPSDWDRIVNILSRR